MHGGCLIILPPPTGQQCRACFPTCISQLTSFAVTTSRTVSELARLTHTLSQCEPNIGTPQVTSGGSGSVISPYCHKVSIRPCVSPLVLPRQQLQSSVGSSSISLTHTYTISSSDVFVKFFSTVFLHQLVYTLLYLFPVLIVCLNDPVIMFNVLP